MAELTEEDKRAIYGAEFEAVIAREEAVKKAPVTAADKSRALAMRLETNDTGRVSSIAIAFTGFCLLLGSLYRTGGVDIAGWIGIGGVLVGAIWYLYLVQNARMWRSQLAIRGDEITEKERRDRKVVKSAYQATA